MLISFLLVFLLGCLVAVVFSINALINTLRFGLPFVSTPPWAVDWLRHHVRLTEADAVYELGCGDARVLAAWAKEFPATTFVGIEIQWWPYVLAKWRTRRLANVKIILGDVFRLDLSPATVVYGFFITGFMPKLAEKLRANLRPGTAVYSYGFRLPAWTTVEEIVNPKKPNGSRILEYRR